MRALRPDSAVLLESPMPNYVNPAVDAMQSSGACSPADGAARIAELPQLLTRHDAILALRQLSKRPVRTHFFPHTGNKFVRA